MIQKRKTLCVTDEAVLGRLVALVSVTQVYL